MCNLGPAKVENCPFFTSSAATASTSTVDHTIPYAEENSNAALKCKDKRNKPYLVNLNSKNIIHQSVVVLTSSTPLVLHSVVAQSTKFMWAKDQLEAQASSHSKIWTMAILIQVVSCR